VEWVQRVEPALVFSDAGLPTKTKARDQVFRFLLKNCIVLAQASVAALAS
jgi:hypothetical protein